MKVPKAPNLHRSSHGSSSRLSRLEAATFPVLNPDVRPVRDPHAPKSQAQLHSVYGCLLISLLVLLSYFAGTTFPNIPKSKPIPTQKRTICKQEAFQFDESAAKGRKVLITGAASFLGSHVARYCSEELQMEVVGIDNLQLGENLQFTGDISIVNGDITDAAFLQKIFARYSFDIIYHLADFSGVSVSHGVPTYTYQNNIVGSSNLITEAVKSNVSKFVMQSSTAVYGSATLPWAESTNPQPVEPYGISKLAVEHHLQSVSEFYGLQYVILRLHSLYGPRQDTLHSSLLAQALAVAVSGGNITVMGDGTQKRQFTFVEDVVRSIVAAAFLEPSNVVFNLGSDEITTVNEVIQALEEITGKQINATYVDRAKNHVHHVQAVHDRSQCLLHLPPYTDFKTGLRKTVDWALSTTSEVRKTDKFVLPLELASATREAAQPSPPTPEDTPAALL